MVVHRQSQTQFMMPPFFAKNSNGGSNCSSSSSDDDIDTPIHKRIPLTSKIHQDDGDTSSATAMTKNNQQPTKMKHSVSMLEMNDIQDMKQFGETMTSLEALQLSTTSSKDEKVNGDDIDDGRFFIGDSTSSAEEDEDLLCDRSNIVSPDSVADIIPPQASGSQVSSRSSGSSMMRRSVSMASLSSSLPSARDKLDLLSVMVSQQMNDMHTIEEDEAKCIDSVQSEKEGDAKEIRRRGKRDKEGARQRDMNDELKHPDDTHECVVGETYDMPLEDHTTTARDCSKVTDDTRRRRVGSRRHDDKPLRSSLKKESSDSLYNLDSSMKSTGSNKMRRNVSFGSIEIRSYPVTLGDAPTTNGPPVQLDWVRIFRLFDILSIIEHSHLTPLFVLLS